MRKESQEEAASLGSRADFVHQDIYSRPALLQQLRDKERELREYKFKYESTKTLYEELLTVLIAQAEKPNQENVARRQGLLHACQYVEDELLSLHVKRADINRIKLTLLDKIERALSPKLKSTSSFVSSSPKLERPNSQIESQTNKLSSTNNSMNSETLMSIGHREKEVQNNYFARGSKKLLLGPKMETPQTSNALASFKEYLITKEKSYVPGEGPGVLGRPRLQEILGSSSKGSRNSSKGHTPRVGPA
jgi:hypothetical protein